MLILLAACDGGQSGENGKGDVGQSPCEETSSAPLSDVPESEWPEGLAELVEVYEGLDGDWTATLRCPDADDEDATLSFEVDPELTLRTFEGGSCEETSRVSGETGHVLASPSFSIDTTLATTLEGWVRMADEGITILVWPDGTWNTSIASPWDDGDAVCELLNVTEAP
ncbi:MAG: hypothetical protein ACOZNI_24545 [Myxococcota bacterium]